MNRGAPRAVVGALTLAVLAGCASVPTRSASHVVQHIDPSDTRSLVGTQRDVRPAHGALPGALISSFLLSMAGWQNGHDASREFLTQTARDNWHDDDQIVVSADAPEVGEPDPNNNVPITFTPVGTVARDGSFTPSLAARKVTWKFRLVKTADGDWRIDTLPDQMQGVLLSYSDFDQFYTAHTVYFLNPSGNRLVPDVRYLPDDPANLAPNLARLLFDDPSAWLAPVVANDLGKVSLNSVDADTERHVVRIDVGGLNAQPAAVRQGAVAQLVYTVGAVPAPIAYNSALYAVQVTSDGRAMDDVPGGALRPADISSFNPEALPDSDQRQTVEAYYLHDGAVYGLDSKRQLVDRRYRLTSVGVSTDVAQLAGVGPAANGHGLTLWLGKLPASARDAPTALRASELTANTLTRPTWDRATSNFWTVANGRFVRRVAAVDGQVRPVQLAGPLLDAAGSSIGALRLAREGTRLALTAGRPGHRLLYVGRVRSAGGVDGQVTIEQPLPVAPNLVDVLDVAWEQPTELLVLGRTRGGTLVAERVSADGSTVQPNPFDLPLPDGGASTISGAPGGQRPVLSTPDGRLMTFNRGWGDPSGDAPLRGSAPTYPG